MRDHQRHSIAHVLQPHASRHIGDRPQLAGQSHAPQIFGAALCRTP